MLHLLEVYRDNHSWYIRETTFHHSVFDLWYNERRNVAKGQQRSEYTVPYDTVNAINDNSFNIVDCFVNFEFHYIVCPKL